MPSGPKREKFTNRHAEAARERDAEKKATAAISKKKIQEDAMWADDDKSIARKAERADAKSAKADEAAARKAERERLIAIEEAENAKPPAKVLRRDLAKEVSRLSTVSRKDRSGALVEDSVQLPDENPNRVEREDDGGITATGIVAVSTALAGDKSNTVVDDRHIGRRARVAYKQFVEMNLPRLKEQKRMRRTQYNDLLWAMWQKSPDNPFVQRAESMAEAETRRKWFEAADSGDE